MNFFNLFAKLFFTKLIQSEEFPRQVDILNKTRCSKFDSHDNLPIGDHHCHSPELNF